MERETHPNWERLYEVAHSQAGYFTTKDAKEAGYSRPLLAKYLQNGKMVRVRRGIYRLVHYPETEDEQLVIFWLWSKKAGVFSHESALFLQDLSDALPSQVHLTLPTSWKGRRVQVPEELVLFYADLTKRETMWSGSIPVTNVARTLRDCAAIHTSPFLLAQAYNQGRKRGVISQEDVAEVTHYLRPFDVTLL